MYNPTTLFEACEGLVRLEHTLHLRVAARIRKGEREQALLDNQAERLAYAVDIGYTLDEMRAEHERLMDHGLEALMGAVKECLDSPNTPKRSP